MSVWHIKYDFKFEIDGANVVVSVNRDERGVCVYGMILDKCTPWKSKI